MYANFKINNDFIYALQTRMPLILENAVSIDKILQLEDIGEDFLFEEAIPTPRNKISASRILEKFYTHYLNLKFDVLAKNVFTGFNEEEIRRLHTNAFECVKLFVYEFDQDMRAWQDRIDMTMEAYSVLCKLESSGRLEKNIIPKPVTHLKTYIQAKISLDDF